MPHLKPYGSYYNPEQWDAITKRIIDSVTTGNEIKVAAHYAGVDSDTINEWMKRGAKERNRRLRKNYVPKEEEEQFAKFSWDLEVAIETAKARCMKIIDDAMMGLVQRDSKGNITEVLIPPNPNMAIWKLAHLDPDRWGNQAQITHVGKDDKPIKFNVSFSDPLPSKKRDYDEAEEE